jgi:hypothetical protein
MVSHLNNLKNVFRPPIFYGHEQFFRASFELFGRKFGYLATVKLHNTCSAFKKLLRTSPLKNKHGVRCSMARTQLIYSIYEYTVFSLIYDLYGYHSLLAGSNFLLFSPDFCRLFQYYHLQMV